MRCAETWASPTTARASTSRPAARLLPRELRTIIVGRIAIDSVDVVDAALRRVLDHEGRPLDAEIRGAARGRRATPGEVRLGEIRPDLGHPRLGERVVHDAGPLPHDVQQHRLLRRRERRRANALGLNRSTIPTGPEHEIGDARPEDCLLALTIIQRVDQRKCLVVLVPQRTYRPAFERVACGLSGGKAGCHARLTPRQRQIDRQMVTAKLQHPRRGHRWRPKEGEVILVLAEPDSATPAAATPRTSDPEHFVTADDIRDLPIAIWTQRRREQVVYGGALRRRQISHPQPLALEDAAWQVGPSGLLRSLERELDLGPTRLVERGQNCLRCS